MLIASLFISFGSCVINLQILCCKYQETKNPREKNIGIGFLQPFEKIACIDYNPHFHVKYEMCCRIIVPGNIVIDSFRIVDSLGFWIPEKKMKYLD